MANIDSPAEIKALDSSGVLESTAKFPDQCQQAWLEASSIKFPSGYENIYNVVVCGMGGSRFTPRTIKELFRDRIKEPYEIVEDYTVPQYVGKDTLVILSSFSGTTEEVLSCGQDAVRRGARISGVMRDGKSKIGSFLAEHSMTGYFFDPRNNPCGQPRIGGGYLLMGHLGILKALKLIDIDEREVSEAVAYARTIGNTCGVHVPVDKNPAKQLACMLKDTHPFIVTSEFLRGFGNAFSNQINETAKMVSDPRNIPELNHHLMEGLKYPETLHQNGLFLFFLSKLYSPLVQKRYVITNTVVEKQKVKTHTVMLHGPTKLAQTLEAFTLSGFTSFYMAVLYDMDPVAIPWVDYFKAELAK
jgi:glucose/mannose-6-phosphate isomerase